ncbi:hypothetical protein [Streptomyces sp. NPDC051684]|uniref:hypothetical protein n=1 Tax=Streptomyces sp. NPDC051684 TaxID=3365670 RepID=UPI0037AC5547
MSRSRWGARAHCVAVLGLCAALAVGADAWQPAHPAVAVLLIGPLLACARLGVRPTLTTLAWVLALAGTAGAVLRVDTGPWLAVEYLVLFVGGLAAVRIARASAIRSWLRRLGDVARAAQAALLRPVEARFGDIDSRRPWFPASVC